MSVRRVYGGGSSIVRVANADDERGIKEALKTLISPRPDKRVANADDKTLTMKGGR